MLSLILSRLFKLAFILLSIFGSLQLFVQIRQKPIYYNRTSSGGYSSFGQPGIPARAIRSSASEKNAPDTTVSYTVKFAPAFSSSSNGSFSWGKEPQFGKSRFDSMYRSWKQKGDSIVSIDTQICIIRNRSYDNSSLMMVSQASTAMQKLSDGRLVSRTGFYDEKGNQVGKTRLDTFPDARAADIFQLTNNAANQYEISQAGITEENLRLKPINTMQRILFIMYSAAIYCFTAWLLLTLSRLFYNFYKHDYFTLVNIRHVRNTGFCILIPQLIHLVFYWGLLFHLHPVKILIDKTGAVSEAAGYQLMSEMNWSYIFLGFGILVLSYIFKNGLRLKENLALTI